MELKQWTEKHQIEFKDLQILEVALTHKSYHFENSKKSLGHNERFEFLGDAVLDLVLADYLLQVFPDENEGTLSKKRANLVNEAVLSDYAKHFGLHQLLRLGKGEVSGAGHEKPRLLASAFEALIGAYYLDQGFEKARGFILSVFQEKVSGQLSLPGFDQDFKTQLQEWTQAKVKVTPSYEVVRDEGPSHDKTFEVVLKIHGIEAARGVGKSKKAAEQAAAKAALLKATKEEIQSSGAKSERKLKSQNDEG